MILVDSDVLIAHLRDLGAATEWMLRTRRESGRLATSAVCMTEVAGGMRSAERSKVVRLLGSMHVFAVSEQVAWQAAELMRRYRRSHTGISLGDYLIAATVETEGLELATLDVNHFPMIRGLKAPFALG